MTMMDDRRRRDGSACHRGEDAIAFASGELSAAEREALAGHLEQCAACRSLAADAEQILGALGGAVETEPVETAAVRPPALERRSKSPIMALRMVAALAAVALMAIVLQQADSTVPEVPQRERPQPSPLAWVEAHLGADGTWYAFSRTGPDAQAPGMHAFGLLALVRGAGMSASADHLTSVRDAASWLIERQNEDGSIGLPMASGHFDHPVAALALMEAAQVTGDAGIRAAAEGAVWHIACQGAALWRRGSQGGQETWAYAALVRADQLGFADLAAALERGRIALGPRTVATLSGDFLARVPFWELALGRAEQPRVEVVDDLFTASLAVLAPDLR